MVLATIICKFQMNICKLLEPVWWNHCFRIVRQRSAQYQFYFFIRDPILVKINGQLTLEESGIKSNDSFSSVYWYPRVNITTNWKDFMVSPNKVWETIRRQSNLNALTVCRIDFGVVIVSKATYSHLPHPVTIIFLIKMNSKISSSLKTWSHES